MTARTRALTAASIVAALVIAVIAFLSIRDTGDDAAPAVGATASQPASAAATSAAAPTSATAAESAAGDASIEPVIDQNFPDPDVLAVGETYYAFATEQPGGSNVATLTSTDLAEWKELPDALPVLPAWAKEGRTWAPEVFEARPGAFVLYFTAWHAESERQCIGVAKATAPAGPFTATSDKPFICPLDQGGAIDAASYKEPADGKLYILWKNDGNCCGKDTWLYLQPVSPDGTTLAGEPRRLIKQDQDFEGDLVEAPTLWKQGRTYFLFYSANFYGDDKYVSSYATAAALTGPYKKANEPLMTTEQFDGEVVGPGGQDVFLGPDGQPRIAFHGWRYANTFRALYIRPLTFEGDKPVVAGID